jgi:hypothetical protein
MNTKHTARRSAQNTDGTDIFSSLRGRFSLTRCVAFLYTPHPMMRSPLLGLAVLTLFLGTASSALAHHIDGKVWCDKDYDGNFDASDILLSNITVRARSIDVDPGTDWTDNTDSNGFYSIGLPGRTDRYSVRPINMPSGYTVVNPAAGNHIVQIITNSDQDSKSNVNFLVQGCSPRPTTTTTSSTTTTTKKTTTTTTSTSSTTTTTKTTTTTTTTRPTTTTSTSSTTTTTKPTTTTSSTSTSSTSTSTTSSTTTTLPDLSCECDGTPFLVNTEGRFNNDGDLRGSLGANDPNGRIQLGKGVVMADDTKITAHSVTVGNGSSVNRVVANDVQTGQGAIIRNGTSLPSLPIIEPFCDLPQFTCGDDAILVAPGQSSAPLPPGTYGRVRVLNGAHLRLAGGVYQFCDIKTGRGATIEAMGPTTINVVGSVSIGTGSQLVPSPPNNLPVVLNVRGHKVRLAQNARAEAIITAPFAKITLGRDSLIRGCFCVDTARTDKHITLVCEE